MVNGEIATAFRPLKKDKQSYRTQKSATQQKLNRDSMLAT